MSSYASYCQDQGIDCARRARLARSLEVATYWRCLGFRWLRLAEQAQRTGGALGRASHEVSNLARIIHGGVDFLEVSGD
jgi:hypothetical protein